MNVYGRLFARLYDRALAGAERAGLAERRRSLLAGAQGRVLEIGAGTGLNLAHYPAGIEEVVLTEPEEPMARRLEARLRDRGLAWRVVRAQAESLPFEDSSFDTVVCTLVLCTVDDPQRALAEIRRVLRPGGRLLFLEHVRSEDPRLAQWQDRLHGLQYRFGHGCHCNRPTLAFVESSGLRVDAVERGRIPNAPPIVRPSIVGRAIAA